MRGILVWLANRYGNPPVYIFENGIVVPGIENFTIVETLHDSFRISFFQEYIKNIREAVTLDGVDVRGYFAWSLLDNWEWTGGLGARFGIIYVDYKDGLKRYMKDSALWYSKFI